MKFSILVPVYNVEKYLKQCINSILDQDYFDMELILVDDGSKDNSGLICDSYLSDTRVRVIHKENQGLVAARRDALKIASGDYIAFCDSDDFIERNYFSSLDKIITAFDPDIILFNAYSIGKDKKPFCTNVFDEGFINDKKRLFETFFLTYKINSLCCKVCRRTLFDIDSDYSDFYDSGLGEDFLQSAPLYRKAGKIYYLNQFLYNYRIESGMMRRANMNYYYAYKKVNNNVVNVLSDCNISDLEQLGYVHLLHHFYGHVMQYKYLDAFPLDDYRRLIKDDDALNAYQKIRENYYKRISRKERAVLYCIFSGNHNLVNILIKVAKLKNRI